MGSRSMSKAIITKFALTSGVFTTEWEAGSNGLIRTPQSGYFHRGEWHLTRSEAVERVTEMRAAKLKSIDRQRAKLQAMDPGGMIAELDVE